MPFLPVTLAELHHAGIEAPDFVLVTGDAYVDHPSFGAALIGRLLEKDGFSVAILAQPDWKDPESFTAFGRPRLGFLVTAGNIDSMVNHYTVAKKPRTKDAYSPGARAGLRPDRAAIVYGNAIRAVYKDIPLILGGLESSLRRFSHYDYWSDTVRRSCLLDAGADLLVYGMGESQILAIARGLRDGLPASELTHIPGTVYRTKTPPQAGACLELPPYTAVKSNKTAYADSFRIQYENTDAITAKPLAENYGSLWVIQNPPAKPLPQERLDEVYAMPFMRRPHPMYDALGGVPAIEEVKFSLISSRGCFGGCHFCALTFHQGRTVTARSHPSIQAEAEAMTHEPDFKGYIHDVGGPTANFRGPSCQSQLTHGVCKHKLCLTPAPCKSLRIDHTDYLKLLRKLRTLPGVKKVFIRSGLRYDYLIYDSDTAFFEELCRHHISGQLKVAPEHVSPRVLRHMGKPTREVYDRFVRKYTQVNQKLGLKQFLVPYLMSSHPGSDLAAAIELAEYLRDIRFTPEQVQDFYPTPGTLSTCMYHTGLDPLTGEAVYVPKNAHEKAMQRALIQYRLPQNEALVREALMKADRKDLIGFDSRCLIRPKSNPGAKPVGVNGKHPQTAHAKNAKPAAKKKTIRNIHKKKK